MNKLLSRILTAAVLTAAAVAFGVWLNRPPLAAAPAITTEAVLAPTLAPPPIPAVPAITIDVPVEVEIAAAPPAIKPAEKPADPKQLKTNCQPSRRGWFRRR
jgi:hypothetical protein